MPPQPPSSRRPSLRHRCVVAAVPVMALALVAAACGNDGARDERHLGEAPTGGPNVEIVIPAGEPVVVGISAPLTGPEASAGVEDRDAAIVEVERWKDENGPLLSGHDVEVVVEDDGCTEVEIASEAAERLVRTAGLVGVVGPNCSAGAVAALPVYAEAGVTAISGSATKSDLTTGQPPGGFFFRTAYRNDLEGTLIGLFVGLDLGAERIYLVDDAEPYAEDLARSAQQILGQNGVDVTRATAPRGTADFSDLVQEVVEADPPFVGFLGFNPDAALFYEQLRNGGYEGGFGAGDAAATPDFISAAGAAAENVLFAGCQLRPPDDFVSAFEELHGHRPGSSPFTAQQADAMTVLLNATAETAEKQPDGSIVIDPTALRDAVRSTVIDGGVSGSFAFDANGDRVPGSGASLPRVVDGALATQDLSVFSDLGLVPCQVQDGRLVNLMGPGARPVRLDAP